MGRGHKFSNNEKKMKNTNEIHDQNWYAKNFPKLNTEDETSTNIFPILAKPRNIPTIRPCDREITYFVNVAEPLCQEVISRSTIEEKKNDKSTKENYEDSEVCCLICRCLIPKNSKTGHLYDKKHINAKKQHRCDDIVRTVDEKYRCKRCDCEILNFETLYRHLTSDEHLTPFSVVENNENREILQKSILEELKIPKENSVENSSISDESMPSSHNSSDIYVVRRNAKKSYCHICDEKKLILTKNIVDHIDAPNHQIALKKYGCNNIVSNENGGYFCNCCKIEIPNVENVYLHVMDKKHMGSLIKVSFERDAHASKDTFERAATPDENYELPLRNTLTGYIFKHITTNSSGNRAQDILKALRQNEDSENKLFEDMKISAKFYDNKPWNCWRNKLIFRQKNTTFKNKFVPRGICCLICEDKIKDLDELLSHMAQHYNEELSSVGQNKEIIFKYSNIETKSTSLPVDLLEVAINRDTSDDEEISSIGSASDEIDLNEDFTSCGSSVEAIATCAEFSLLPGYREKLLEEWRENSKSTAPNSKPATDYIYDMSEKKTILKFGLNLALIIDSQSIYCLICRKTVKSTMQNYFEHLWSIDHCEYLEMMEKDHALFAETPDEFSDLDLACEFMQEINDDLVRCLICNVDVGNSNDLLKRHIYDEIHESLSKKFKTNAMSHYDENVSRIHCDWYSVEKYWCVPCLYKGFSSSAFIKHLNNKNHTKELNTPNNTGKKMMFDFCPACALLWYGYRSTYSYHSEVATHKWLLNEGYYTIGEIPETVKNFLALAEKYAEEAIKSIDDTAEAENDKLKTLIEDIEIMARIKLPKAKAYVFGSRAAGVGSSGSNVDVFLDCRDLYNGQQVPKSVVSYFTTAINTSMSQYPGLWEVETIKTENQLPIIKATHRPSGLTCDISFKNGIAVESSKLVRTINNVFPSCRKLILVLKRWLTLCNLLDSKEITTYALCWLVIFYLQQESILPSIVTLVTMKKKSRIIDGCETGVSHDFSYNEAEQALTIEQLLKGFFTFYADFDFRYEVASPFLGTTIKKYDFDNSTKFSVMTEYLRNFGRMENFDTSSPMCIQDPFDLRCNLTHNAKKCYTNCFRVYCSKSRDMLC